MTSATMSHPVLAWWTLSLSSIVLLSGSRAEDLAADWRSAVEQRIADSEYEVTWQPQTLLSDLDSSWQAPNRAHNFRTYFTGDGIRVIPRTTASDADPLESPRWEWGMELLRWGRPGAAQGVDPAHLEVHANEVEYRRGAIVEWYINDRRGLKQGFTIENVPAPGARDHLVQLDLSLVGTLSPKISGDGQAIDFATPRGVNVLHYAGLEVEDARGRELPSWMEGFSQPGVRGFRIVFDDEGAVYPVHVDPLATSAAWTAESDQADARFGTSVSTAGDVNGDGYADAIVGAHFFDNGQADEGRAFVYHGSPAGLGATPAWTVESDQASALFGYSVATAGDVNGDGYADVVVGAHQYTNGESAEGRAFVYHGSAVGLASTPSWNAEGDQTDARFGVSVAAAGDINGDGYADVLVGADDYDNSEIDEGRAFVYHGSAAGLASTPAWTAESDQVSGQFGTSVATAGDVNGDGYADVIVGAYRYDNGRGDEGRAYVYHGSALGLAATAAWTAESDQANALFGASVTTAGDVNGDGYADVIVGAYQYSNGQSEEGRAFVYHGSAAGLAATPVWTAESDQANALFGYSVAPAADVNGDGYADVIVGAPFYENGESAEGFAFVYHGSAAGLAATPVWTAGSGQASALSGYSVATAGDVNGDGYADVIVGAYAYDNGENDEGRASVFHGSPTGLALTAGWAAESDQAAAQLGCAVATAGDVNGDGYADVIVGARGYDNGEVNEGRALVYLGTATGLAPTPAWSAESDQEGAFFGTAVATAGDVNGDGYAEVIVGARSYSNGQNEEGGAFVFHGSPAGLAATPSWTAEGNQKHAEFGWSVASAGDVNGDGHADVIVGAYQYDNGQDNEGRAFVYHGSTAGLATTPAWTVESNQGFAAFGFSVATAGDVNGDGYADVIVGAWGYANGQNDEGRAFVYHGSPVGLSSTPAWSAESDQALAFFGWSVGSAGDVNGDGYADVLIGSTHYDNGQIDEGRAFVHHGSAAGLATAPTWSAEADALDVGFGLSVATAGDVNGDGYADIVVGATRYDNGESNEGRAFFYHGSAAGLDTTPTWSEINQAYALFGTSVASAGDVNGDGYADVLIGSTHYDNGQSDEGRVFLYYGNGGPGLSLKPRQRRASDTDPIAHLGTADSPDSFRLLLLGRTPFGRGRVQLEWEVKPLGQAFNGIGSDLSAVALDSGIGGVELNELETGLLGETPYHWRVRLHYDPATAPFAQRSRWLRVPWDGWQEMDLRTPVQPAGRVSDGSPGPALILAKATAPDITLSWGASCLATDTDYEIYEGVLGNFTSHASRFCSTGGSTTMTFAPAAGDAYYLVVPRNAAREGSYGRNSGDLERPPAAAACLPQLLGNCP